jgi:hypothetical protein
MPPRGPALPCSPPPSLRALGAAAASASAQRGAAAPKSVTCILIKRQMKMCTQCVLSTDADMLSFEPDLLPIVSGLRHRADDSDRYE